MKNILVTSLGTTWSIVPELIGFTNPETYNLYKNHPNTTEINTYREDYNIHPIDELWVVTTNGNLVKKNLNILKNWFSKFDDLPSIRLYSYKELQELNSTDEILSMRDLVYRTVLHAKEQIAIGKLYLSLAGGRKNMSADIQDAAYLFGCDALIHVMDNGNIDPKFNFRNKTEEEQIQSFLKIPGSEIQSFNPVVIQGDIKASPIIYAEPKLVASNYILQESIVQEKKMDLFTEIKKRRRESANSLLSIYKKQIEGSQTTYSAFQLLSPKIIDKLKREKIGKDPINKEPDLKWLNLLPKPELHCHFGGILSPEEMIEVTKVNRVEIDEHIKTNKEFGKWIDKVLTCVKSKNLSGLDEYNPKKNIKEYWLNRGIPEPIAITAFILAFENNAPLLNDYIYKQVDNFKGVGITKYENLGDLQGSSLLQNEKSIRKTCQILKLQCVKNNIKYIEVRCSPVNYTRAGLDAERVVEIMMDELQSNNTIFRLIFIASRHGNNSTTNKHIELALNMLKKDTRFKQIFVGFDLAGDESAKRPEELRDVFIKILEKSIPTTIHAGEDMNVKNIWEAIYHLSAERIGHGLTLNDDSSLINRIRERKIAIELCPSSNDQIIGYHDFSKPITKYKKKIYPLKSYLDEGLKITINTDDPGISLTNLTKEYYKGACMCKGGLSKWEILQINRNGFKYGFLPISDKKQLLIEVEEELFDILNS